MGTYGNGPYGSGPYGQNFTSGTTVSATVIARTVTLPAPTVIPTTVKVTPAAITSTVIIYGNAYSFVGGGTHVIINAPAAINGQMVATSTSVSNYAAPAAPVYTTTQYRERVLEPQTVVTRRVEIYDPSGIIWDDGADNYSRLITGNVSVDYSRDERRSLDVELANFDNALVHKPDGFWYDKYLKVYRGVQFYDASGLRSYEVPIGTFLIDRVSAPRFPNTVKITGRDFTKKCLLSKFTLPTSFSATLSPELVIGSLATNAGITQTSLVATGAQLGVTTLFDAGKSRWEAMKEIALAFNYELYFDVEGTLTMREFQDPTLGTVQHVFNTGPSGNLADWEKTTSDGRVFNHIVVEGQDVNDLPVWAEAINTAPDSPTNVASLGDRVMEPIRNSLITTVGQAQQLADSMLKINALEEYEVNMSSIVMPWIEAGEVIQFLDPDAPESDPDKFLLTDFNIPLGLEPMGATGRRLTIVG